MKIHNCQFIGILGRCDELGDSHPNSRMAGMPSAAKDRRSDLDSAVSQRPLASDRIHGVGRNNDLDVGTYLHDVSLWPTPHNEVLWDVLETHYR